jgi:uncharacterized protein YukE
MNPAFAAQERAALQQVRQANSVMLAQPVPTPARQSVAQHLTLLKQEKAALVAKITQQLQRVTSLTHAFAAATAKAEEAAEKSKTWSIIGAVVAAVVAIVVAVVVTVFSFGAAAPAMAAALAGMSTFASTAAAAPIRHPLAGEFSSILAALAAAVNNFSRERQQDMRAAVAKLMDEIDRTLTRLERLPGPVGNLKGCCQGDPRAAFDTYEALRQSLTSYAAILQRVPREDMDTRPIIANVSTLQASLAKTLKAPAGNR